MLARVLAVKMLKKRELAPSIVVLSCEDAHVRPVLTRRLWYKFYFPKLMLGRNMKALGFGGRY